MTDFDEVGVAPGLDPPENGLGEPGDAEQSPVPAPIDADDYGEDGSPVDDASCECCVPAYDGSYDALPGSQDWAPNGSLTLLVDGEAVDLGIPTLDFDGDGVPDSAVVNGANGQLYLVTDVTGDGAADGVVVADGQGRVVVAYEIGADGEPVAIRVPEGLTLQEVLGQDPGATIENPTPGPDPGDDDQIGVAPVPQDDGAVGGRVVLNDGDQLIDLGPATHDLDGDGVKESVIVPDDSGRPAWVVTEVTATGATDLVLVLDPATGEVAQSFLAVDGEAQQTDPDGDPLDGGPAATTPGGDPDADPGAAVPGDAAAGPGAATEPEKIVAPGAEVAGGNVWAQVMHQQTQQMYDVASEVWFELTGGEPYPRHEDGTPHDPGQVFATLADRPDVPEDAKFPLQEMMDTWTRSQGIWAQPSGG